MPKHQILLRRQYSQGIWRRGNLRKKKLKENRSKWREWQFKTKLKARDTCPGGPCQGKPHAAGESAKFLDLRRNNHQTRSKFGLSNGFLPTLAMLIHSPCTFTRTTSPVKSVTVPPLLLNSHEPTA